MAKKAAPVAAEAPPVSADVGSPTAAEYTVLARRYRPQQFNELIGQEAIAQALSNAITGNRVAHAYLFTGARGVGKTSAARILAKCLNCEKGPTLTPCDQCSACRAIATGDDVDVVEIDGASNRNLDDVRELRQNVQYRPQRSRFKIYIIDEVHMLTRESFNALLKTLEEPPPHVKFLFATTEVQKVPITILSRCQRFDFGNVSRARIKDRLREIIHQEQAEAEEGALDLLARRAGGSMRDAQSLLDQALAFAAGKLTTERMNELLGTADEESLVRLGEALLQRDAAKALALFDKVCEKAVQFGELVEQLIQLWRQFMLLKSVGSSSDLLDLSEPARTTLAPWVQSLSLDTILAALDLLVTAKGRMRATSHHRVLVEMTLVRLCELENLVPLADLARWVQAGGNGGVGMAAPKAERPRVLTAPSVERATSTATPAAGPTPLTPENLEAVWQQALQRLPGMMSLHLRRAARQTLQPPAHLVIGFAPADAKDREYCEDGSRAERLAGVLREITGQTVHVRFDTVAADAAPTKPETSADAKRPDGRQKALQEPLVKAAIEKLGAQLLRFEDEFGQGAAAGAT